MEMQRLQSDNALQTHCGLMMFAAVELCCVSCVSVNQTEEEVSAALTL